MFCVNCLVRINKCQVRNARRYISVLYLTGDKARENYAPLTPYMDFKERLDHPARLQENFSRRGLNVDMESLTSKFEKYSLLQKEKVELQNLRQDITDKIKHLDKNVNKTEIEELKSKAIAARTELKTLNEKIYHVEDDFIHQFLSLPNELHERLQSSKETLLYRHGLPNNNIPDKKSHLSHTHLIDYKGKDCYYLLDDAAEFELDAIHSCRNLFVGNNFVSTTNPDFTRKVLIEANLVPTNQYHGVYEEDQRHHLNSAFLTGGGSFESFLGHLAKLSVYPSVLPLRLVSTGRQYKLKENEPVELGLYAATQSNVVQTLVASRTKEEADQEMDDILNLAVDFYKKLGIHYRVVFVNAPALTLSESLRASIEVYSPVHSRYVEVGHVSHYLDFVSKRILFTTKEKKETKFLHLVGGPIVSSSVLIAALIENQVPLILPREESNLTSQVEVFKNLFK